MTTVKLASRNESPSDMAAVDLKRRQMLHGPLDPHQGFTAAPDSASRGLHKGGGPAAGWAASLEPDAEGDPQEEGEEVGEGGGEGLYHRELQDPNLASEEGGDADGGGGGDAGGAAGSGYQQQLHQAQEDLLTPTVQDGIAAMEQRKAVLLEKVRGLSREEVFRLQVG